MALDLPVDRVGLVASVAACCAGYATVLTGPARPGCLRDGAGVTRAPLDRGSVDALQAALATEHAALWCYSLAVAFLPAEQLEQARRDEAAHRALRGSLERMLAAAGARAVAALPAYAPPQPVVDGPSAAALAVVAEGDSLAAWKSVLEHTLGPGAAAHRAGGDGGRDAAVRTLAGRRGHPAGDSALPRPALIFSQTSAVAARSTSDSVL